MSRRVLFSLLTVIIPCVTASFSQPVNIPDANLKACIEAALGVSDPNATDMNDLTLLHCIDSGIEDLTGLEFATNLEELLLGYNQNQISDISPLAGLTKLINLDLNNNPVSDFSVLSGLTNLRWLELIGVSGIQNNLSLLSNLTNLWHLELSGIGNGDFSAIAGLTNLRELGLRGNQMSDVSSLSGLTNLTWLELDGNLISDISVLSGMTNLQWLGLQYNQISDIEALSGLTNLNYLNLHANPLNQAACDEHIPQIIANNPGINLISRDCIGDPVEFADANLKACIEAVLGFANPTPTDMNDLTLLHCIDSGIEDLTGLESATNLEELLLGYNQNQISDISPLAGLTKLVALDLNHNPISDFSVLSGLTNLEFLELVGVSGIQNNLSVLSNLTNLRHLELSELGGDDFSAISGLTNLTILGLRHNSISDVSQLSSLVNLEWLELDDNLISDISVLSGMTNLQWLGLQYNHISDIEALSGLTNLTYLDLRANPLNQTACDIYIPLIAANNPGIDLLYNNCIYVDPNDPNGTISQAIDQAQDGDTIVVPSGTYYGPIDFQGKSISLIGELTGDPNTGSYPVIDANGTGPVITFGQGEDPNTQISGFVLIGGSGSYAATVSCIGSSPVIRNCLIVGNRCPDPDVREPDPAVIYCVDSNAIFENCTIAHNDCGTNGAALRVVDCNITVVNSIIWGNVPTQIVVDSGNDPLVVYSNVQGTWPGPGNIDADPMFVLPGSWTGPGGTWIDGDYHLLSASPCIDAGDPNTSVGNEPEPNGGRINQGAYGGTDEASMTP